MVICPAKCGTTGEKKVCIAALYNAENPILYGIQALFEVSRKRSNERTKSKFLSKGPAFSSFPSRTLSISSGLML